MADSSPVYADGFGRRVVRVTAPDAAPTEHLHLDAVLANHPGFSAALRERVAALQGRRLTSYARVLRLDVDGPAGASVVSEYVGGWRLADVLDVAESENLTFDIGVVMLLLRQLLPTASLLTTQGRDSCSGALGPEHLILTPQGRIVLTDYVLGPAIEALGWGPEQLWRVLRVVMPLGSGGRAVSQRGDVVQVGVTVLSLVVGRRLRDDEFPDRLEGLVNSARQKTSSVIDAPLSPGLRDWLNRALQLAPRNFSTLFEAHMALERLLTADLPLLAQPSELDQAVARFERFMPVFELPEPPLMAPPPPDLVPTAVAFDRPAPAPAPAPAPGSEPEPPARVEESAPPPRPRRKSGVRKSQPVEAPATSAADAAVAAPAESPAAAPVSAKPPAKAPAKSPTEPPAKQPAVAAVAAPAATASEPLEPVPDLVGVAPATPATTPRKPTVPAPSTPPARPATAGTLSLRDEDPSPDVEVPVPATAWWQAGRLVAALFAVAVIQGVVIGWLLTRQSEHLGADGELVVSSRPDGAAVVVDDRDHGVTPVSIRLSPGPHVLLVRAGGGEPRVIPVSIRAGVQTAQYVELQGVATTGVLEVRSDPSRAKVIIDGQERGSTPLTLRDVAPGDYRVVLERAGWKSTQVVRVEPGGTAQLVVPMR